MLRVTEIEGILGTGHETSGFELKGPGNRTDSHFFAKIARAALSLGNIRDGGHIVIGIDDDNPANLGPGLDQADLDSWTDYDEVARKLAVYADPPLRFELESLTLSSAAEVVVIQVHEFADIPHLCAKAYDDVLREGAVYVRPRKVPETSEIASLVEMRDLLELATEKGVRRFVETASRAGLDLGGSGAREPRPDDNEQFERERQAGWE